jgi:bifunctional non-homologous end joining protein LigD
LKRLDRLVDDPNYQYEMKYDGFRGVGYFEKGRRCRFVSRNGNHLSRFQPLCESILKELKVQNAIFDGELISPDPTGRPIFKNMLRRGGAFQYVAFDLLWLNGEDLRSLPLEARRQKLLKVLPKSSRWITESLVQIGSGLSLYNLMVQYDLEGIVVKRLASPYSRSTKWYKFKNKDYSQAKGRRHFF